MKQIVKSLFILLLAISCNNTTQVENQPGNIEVNPPSSELNLNEGYFFNQLTNDTIQDIIDFYGDTVITGQEIDFEGETFSNEEKNFIKKQVKYNPSAVSHFEAYPNFKMASGVFEEHQIKKENLKVINVKSTFNDTTPHFIIGALGDTIPTGVPFKMTGEKVKLIQPEIVAAKPPSYKDATSVNIQYFDIYQGLKSSTSRGLLQDSKGNIWMGTSGGGASKYDGHNFIHYSEESGLYANSVNSFYEDLKGNIWMATDQGLSKFDGESFTNYTEENGLPFNRVWDVKGDKDGVIWFGGVGCLNKLDGDSLTIYSHNEGMAEKVILSLLIDHKNRVLVGTNGGGLHIFDGENITILSSETVGLNRDVINDIEEDKNGVIWLALGMGGGLNRFDGNSIKRYSTESGLNHNIIRSTLIDSKGNIWFGTYGAGITKCEINEAGEIISLYTFDESNGLTSNVVEEIMEDNAGNIWCGTKDGGVCMIDFNGFENYAENEGISNRHVSSIAKDKNGDLWFATFGAGVTKYNGQTFSHIDQDANINRNFLRSIYNDKTGNIWMGYNSGGVSKFDGETFTNIYISDAYGGSSISLIYNDNAGNYWFGNDLGISKFDGNEMTHYHGANAFASFTIHSILEDDEQTMWMGSHGRGLYKIVDDKITYYTEREGLSSNFVSCLSQDPQGRIWIGTYFGGINVFDGESFTYYSEKDGLPSNNIRSIIQDPKGNFWLGTSNGVAYICFDNPKPKIYSFGNLDGLKGINFNSNSVEIDNENKIWWGTDKGLVALDVDNLKLSENPPQVSLRQLDLHGKFVDFRNNEDSLLEDITYTEVASFENYPLNLKLPYNKNHLTFHFSALDWNAPHKIKYSYILEGLNNDWSEPSDEGKAEYRNLPHGQFNFKVCAIGESGEWSQPFIYSFTITPPWWKTWFARISFIVIVLLIMYVGMRLRTRQLKIRQKELETKVDIATQEIRTQKEAVEKQKAVIEQTHKQLADTHQELEEKNTEILDSIQYAKRIQSAILPPEKLIHQHLPNSFILYKPKDIVAGDFYWMEVKPNEVLIAAADCTGHGVPGAMVSVICNNGLNRSVREFSCEKPGEILDKTRELVIAEFEKSEEEVKDGMDIALVSLTLNKKNDIENENEDNEHSVSHSHSTSHSVSHSHSLLKYAGAHNPLWVIRKGETEIEEIKADKQPIGKFIDAVDFQTHEITLNKGDRFYIFSDGFADQFGGDKGKKFKSSNFKKLLLSIQSNSMFEQQAIIDQTFEEWKGHLEQLDDVCVIGVEV
ncbi:SpoIIE family protein phosphatase [Paracrocinitomix mangrovi]|uniref:ligand-binding sensor domain-containing protein n=1 Tax=Paracrocinitomix mangrovi TaxID=2862509 RepID=UPI001C8D5357|nr:two-component regulator propeller domain-containing protein [Paracrocinitomix mangrovi]UKN00360.1 SpoIIE family protein phosphatase [Paracrocinitomix mangrovi]